jgi:hypothetical protein
MGSLFKGKFMLIKKRIIKRPIASSKNISQYIGQKQIKKSRHGDNVPTFYLENE